MFDIVLNTYQKQDGVSKTKLGGHVTKGVANEDDDDYSINEGECKLERNFSYCDAGDFCLDEDMEYMDAPV